MSGFPEPLRLCSGHLQVSEGTTSLVRHRTYTAGTSGTLCNSVRGDVEFNREKILSMRTPDSQYAEGFRPFWLQKRTSARPLGFFAPHDVKSRRLGFLIN